MNDNIGIYNHETGKQTVRKMSDDEQAARTLDSEAADSKAATAAQAIEAIATQKAALLERLGITADEAKLLLG